MYVKEAVFAVDICPVVLKLSNLKPHETLAITKHFKQDKLQPQLVFIPGSASFGFRKLRCMAVFN